MTCLLNSFHRRRKKILHFARLLSKEELHIKQLLEVTRAQIEVSGSSSVWHVHVRFMHTYHEHTEMAGG